MDAFAPPPGVQLASGSAGVLAGQPAAGVRDQMSGSPSCASQLHPRAKQIGPEVQIFSSSLGAMVSLLAKLRSMLVDRDDQLPEPLKVHKDKLQLLRQDLEAINTSLVNLSWVEAPNMMVKHWMNEVRDLSYDIEDYIDKTMRSDSEAEELSTLVKQAKDAHERHDRYDLGRWASNTRSVIDGQGRVPRSIREAATDLFGISDSKAQLMKQLNVDAEGRLVVCIQGPAGVGKTTLAQEVYCEIQGQFDCRALVRASKMPDTRRLLGSIISQIQGRHQRPPHGLPVQELIDSLRKHLQQKSYFIVIDGLWETTSWDIVNIAFPEDTHCSRILITTDIEEVALECCDYQSDDIFKMEPISGNYSRELFFNRVFGFNQECSRQLEENSEEITRTCGGMPLAIISIASILASQSDNLELWHRVKEFLFSRLRYNITSEVILRDIVGLSCNSLPQHLKTCLLYLGMYPEGYTFLKADLVKQWSAEGFIIAVEEKNCDDIAECCFDELICRGLIQPNHTNISGEVILYTLHSTVFEVIRTMSNEENFSTVIDYSNTVSELSTKVRRLSLRFSSAKYATKPESITLSPIRSLVFYGLVECLPSIKQFDVLRVLNLEVWGDDQEELDVSGINKLFQLRYIRIISNIIVKLPARMIGLPYLQTMEIYARVTSVPSDIIHLPRLLHLCVHGEINLPIGIGHMRSLRTLQSFDLSSNSEDNIRQLGEMTDLHDLHVISPTEMFVSLDPLDPLFVGPLHMKLIALVSSLEKLCNLKSIILAPASASSCTNIYLDCPWSISPLSVFIQRLELLPPFCIFSTLPVWIERLRNLCVLKIVLRELTTADVDSIAKLQKLTTLCLYVGQPITELIVFHPAAFPALKCFKFRCGIMRLAFLKDTMPSIRRLKLEFNAHSGEQSSNMLAGIEHLLNLKEITGRIGAAPGAEESDRMAVESVFKDAISKHARHINFNLQIVCVFHEECAKGSMLSSQDELNRNSMADGISELNEEMVSFSREVSQFNHDASSILSEDTSIAPHVDGSSGGGYTTTLSQSQSRSPDDGYNWREYGQEPGTLNPHSYYVCTFPNCPVNKKVEMSQDGQITNIEYKGTHNHVRLEKVARHLMADGILQSGGSKASSKHKFGGMSLSGITTLGHETPKNSSVLFRNKDTSTSSPRPLNSSGNDELDRDETDSKRRRREDSDHVGRQPEKVVSQTMSDVDNIDDGYRWRKYGQKLKGKTHPRSYYRCATVGCPARKQVVRSSHDQRLVVTKYESKHNHDVHQQPPAVAYPSSGVGEQQDAQGEEAVDPLGRQQSDEAHPSRTVPVP